MGGEIIKIGVELAEAGGKAAAKAAPKFLEEFTVLAKEMVVAAKGEGAVPVTASLEKMANAAKTFISEETTTLAHKVVHLDELKEAAPLSARQLERLPQLKQMLQDDRENFAEYIHRRGISTKEMDTVLTGEGWARSAKTTLSHTPSKTFNVIDYQWSKQSESGITETIKKGTYSAQLPDGAHYTLDFAKGKYHGYDGGIHFNYDLQPAVVNNMKSYYGAQGYRHVQQFKH